MNTQYAMPFPHEGLAFQPLPPPSYMVGVPTNNRRVHPQQPPFPYGVIGQRPGFVHHPVVPVAHAPVLLQQPTFSTFSTPLYTHLLAVPPPPPYDPLPQQFASFAVPTDAKTQQHASGQGPFAAPKPVVVNKEKEEPRLIVEASTVDYDLIVPGAASVPPPPAVERSAVPLTDFAVEMIWEVCQPMFDSESTDDSYIDKVQQEDQTQQRAQSGRTTDTFGVIGDGRRKRAPSKDGSCSDSSSPASSIPGTPANLVSPLAIHSAKTRLEGLDLASSPLRFSGRMMTSPSSPQSVGRPPYRRPSSSFRTFVRHVLTATLVYPEDLILAICYIAKIRPHHLLAPGKPDDARSPAEIKAEAIKAAPYKLFLGALMLANKTLQDNSYRNETFATVSGVPLKDVNELEMHIFQALDYKTVVEPRVWKTWVGIIRQRHYQNVNTLAFGEHGVASEVESALNLLWRHLSPGGSTCGTINHSPSSPRPTPATVTIDESLAMIDLDASGPLKECHAPALLRTKSLETAARRAVA